MMNLYTSTCCLTEYASCTRCGNCLEAEEVMVCCECGGSIREGEEFSMLGGGQYCQQCVADSTRTASVDMIPYM